MAELSTENLAQGQTTTEQTSEFASLLLQEFKPKTERAREAVETAVRTLAEHALEQTSLISNDAIKSIESIIAAIDAKLTAQVNLIMHHADFQQLVRLARPALPGQQHRDRRATEDPRAEHLQAGAAQDPEEIQGHHLGPEPDLQEALRRGIRPVRRRALWLPGRRLLLRPVAAGRRAARRDGEDLRRHARAVHFRRLADGDGHGFLAGTVQPARPDQDLHHPGIRRLAFAARVRGLPLHRPDHAALPGAPALRGEDRSGGRVRLRGRNRRRRQQQVRLGQLGLRDGGQHQPLLQALRLVLADPRRRVRRRGAGPAGAPSPPTTAAWT